MRPNEQQKITFINEHFAYEVTELLNCLHFHLSLIAGGKEINRGVLKIYGNASLEHILLHGRNLLEFYYQPKKGHRKASAWAYISDWKPPAKSPNVQELQTRVNDEIVHLGWKRLEVRREDKAWNPWGVINELLDLTTTFLAQLDQRFYGDGLKRLVGQMKENRPRLRIVGGKQVVDYIDFLDLGASSLSKKDLVLSGSI